MHGTLGDFRTWNAVLGPLSKKHRVIALSLRRFFPEHWDGVGNDYLMAQHVADVIGFIEKLNAGPVDLIGHSRGGHIGFRVAQARPDLLRRPVLPNPAATSSRRCSRPPRLPVLCRWVRAFRSQPRWCETATLTVRSHSSSTGSTVKARGRGGLRRRGSNCATISHTLLGQVGENRKPFLKSEAKSIETPTLLIGGGDTKGGLAVNWRVLAEHIPGARTAIIPGTRHWMFEQAPQEFCDVVLDFLKA